MTRPRDPDDVREERDLALGTALEELDTPEYPAGFTATVWDRIEAEDEAADHADSVGRSPGPRRFWRRRPVLAGLAAAAAAAAVLALTLVGLPGGERQPLGPQPAAAELLARMTYGMSTTRALTGKVAVRRTEVDGTVAPVREGTFVVTSDGSWRYDMKSGPDPVLPGDGTAQGPSTVAYDAGTHTGVILYCDPRAPRRDRSGAMLRNVDESMGLQGSVLSGYSSGVRAALAEAGSDLKIEEITYRGRPAWRATIPAAADALSPMTPAAVVVVDRETGLMVRQVEYEGADGRVVTELSHLMVNPEVPADTFAIEIPAGVRSHEVDMGVRYMSLDEACDLVGFPIPVPQQVPEGFVAAEVSVRGGTPGVGSGAPDEPYSVTLKWRRGLDVFEIDVLATQGGSLAEIDRSFADILAGAPGPQTTELGDGLFDGRPAHTALGPNPENASMGDWGPMLVVVNNDVIAEVIGDLSRQEMLDVAESLED